MPRFHERVLEDSIVSATNRSDWRDRDTGLLHGVCYYIVTHNSNALIYLHHHILMSHIVHAVTPSLNVSFKVHEFVSTQTHNI